MEELFRRARMELWSKVYSDCLYEDKSREDAIVHAGLACKDFCDMFKHNGAINNDGV